MNLYALADWLLEQAQKVVEELKESNDDSRYGLLESTLNHIVSARGDLDADLK